MQCMHLRFHEILIEDLIWYLLSLILISPKLTDFCFVYIYICSKIIYFSWDSIFIFFFCFGIHLLLIFRSGEIEFMMNIRVFAERNKMVGVKLHGNLVTLSFHFQAHYVHSNLNFISILIKVTRLHFKTLIAIR